MSSKPVLAGSPRARLIVFTSLVAAGCVLIWWGWSHRAGVQTGGKPATGTNANVFPTITNSPAATPPVPAVTRRSDETAQFSWFQKRPLAVARESETYQWTAEDGRDLNVIQQLAHNHLEFERMVGENDRIFRRQLVYHRDTAAAQVERAKLTGEPLREMRLPGLDGQEIRFEIVSADPNPAGQQGAFSGRVAGQLDSMVTFAFKGGREAFTVLSPADNLYLIGEPREPGELIVKSIDITNYSGAGGNPRTPGPGDPRNSDENQQ